MAEQQVKTMLEVPVRDLLAVAPFRAEMDVRFYLNGIFIEPYNDGCMLVATDGHLLAAYESKEARVDQPRILSVNGTFERAFREHGGLGIEKVVRTDSGHAAIVSSVGEYYIHPGKPFVDGKYPDWRKVFPPQNHLQRGMPATIAGRYLATLQRALPKELRDRGSGVQFWYDDRHPTTGPIVTQYESFPGLIVLIMPITARRTPTWPEWWPAPAEEAPQAEVANG